MFISPAWLEDGIFLSAIDSSLNCIIVLDRKGRILYVNKAGLALTDRDFAQLKGRAWASLLPEPLRPDIDNGLKRVLEGGTFRTRAESPNGGVMKWWDATMAPLRDDDEIVGVLVVAIDVTSSVRAQRDADERAHEAMRTANALRAASRMAQLGGWRQNCLTQRVFFTAELRDVIGAQQDQPVTDAVKAWVEDDRQPFLDALERSQAMGEPFSFEGRFTAPDGSVRWLRVLGEPEMVDGVCVSLSGASQDVTEAREAVARLQASEQTAVRAAHAMSSFLATMSHEIRTPLNGVLGMAQAMARDALPEGQRARLEVIRNSGEALLTLLNDLLDLSKIESGEVVLEDGVIDARALADGVGAFRALVQDKDVALTVALDPSAEGLWTGDPARVRQVLHNLVSNAVKFTERGEIEAAISHDGTDLILKVSDTGVGIDQDLLHQVFDKFVQADASMTRRFGGSGLGLTICRDLAALMHGRIEVESAKGVGAAFTVRLPAARVEPAVAAREAAETASASEAEAPEAEFRVLAAEDNPTNQLVLKTLLAEAGIHPVFVDNGQEAVDAWRGQAWDIVLMDIQMPVMDGVTAVKAMRQAENLEGRARTPIIAVTANAMAHHRAEYLAAGMDEVVAKPINLIELLHAMDCALDGPAVHAAG
jgi:PAS domain S-box-containing protein